MESRPTFIYKVHDIRPLPHLEEVTLLDVVIIDPTASQCATPSQAWESFSLFSDTSSGNRFFLPLKQPQWWAWRASLISEIVGVLLNVKRSDM